MIQGGDPNTRDNDPRNDGQGGPDYQIEDEFNALPHQRGVVSMANKGNPNSAGSQFFIVVKDAPFLDHQYTVFGEVVSGMEVVDQISLTPVEGDRAKERVEMKVKIEDGAPPVITSYSIHYTKLYDSSLWWWTTWAAQPAPASWLQRWNQ